MKKTVRKQVTASELKYYNFRVTKEVAADSKEAKKQEKTEESQEKKPAPKTTGILTGYGRCSMLSLHWF